MSRSSIKSSSATGFVALWREGRIVKVETSNLGQWMGHLNFFI